MPVINNPPPFRPSSPDHLQMSLAAAMTLKLKEGLFYRQARLYCLNLLLTYPDGCRGNCSYCGLQKSRDGSFTEKSFIRVSWPTYDLETIIQKTLENRHRLHRICLSMITHPRALEDTLMLIRRFREEVGLPISVLMNPTSMQTADVAALKQAGAQMAAVALDLADEALFDRHRGAGTGGPHRFDHYWALLTATAEVFGKNKAGCHLICGLGEREEDLVQRIQAVRDLGARTHLFSFYPEKGSRLAEAPACPEGQFRRVQLARFLIDNDLSHSRVMAFDPEGRIRDFGLPPEDLEQWIASGRPFMTSGCPGGGMEAACNRPFGDGPPSAIRSFPFQPEEEDLDRIKEQLGWGAP
ncbi:MAG: radical SAM protein [Deltaproteobacteria bacterium]|nr:radical SAM protein [Deltaproteobacteria bacterium]